MVFPSNKKTFWVFLLVLFLVFGFTALVTYAQENQNEQEGVGYQLLEPIPGFIESDAERDIGVFLNGAWRLGVAVASGLAVLMIVVGGIIYMSGESITSKDRGRKYIVDALFGLALILFAFLGLRTINPELVEFKFIETLQRAVQQTEEQSMSTPTTTQEDPDGSFDFTSDALAQLSAAHDSTQLDNLLTCMARRAPGNVGLVTSISDSAIVSGQCTFQTCADGSCVECSHTTNSCHYGGRQCVGKSYAVDFGDEENSAPLCAAAQACGGAGTVCQVHQNSTGAGSHVHISIGNNHGCVCT